LDAVLLAALAGALLGALAVAVRWGLSRSPDSDVGALVAIGVGFLIAAVAAVPSAVTDGVDPGELWPFFAAGLIVPGASQIFLTLAVRHAGPSRAAILMGTAPLVSIAIALTLLDEPFRPLLLLGTMLIVLGGVALARERTRPEHFRLIGAALALLCAILFAARDNVVRWAAREVHPPPLVSGATTLLGAALFILVYVLFLRRHRLRVSLASAVPAFAPAGLALALGYDALLAALDRGRVSIVAPLNATGSLWAVFLAALVIGSSEMVGRRTVVAGLFVVSGGALIGAVR
jgi:drug/metabolite transporter (DMT)-like permease